MWLSWMSIVPCTRRLLVPFLVMSQAGVMAQSPVGGSQEAADGCFFFTLMCHLMHTADPNRQSHNLHLQEEEIPFSTSAGERKDSSLPSLSSQWEITQKNHYTSSFQFPPMDSSFTTALSKFIKEPFSSFILWTCTWFVIRLPN